MTAEEKKEEEKKGPKFTDFCSVPKELKNNMDEDNAGSFIYCDAVENEKVKKVKASSKTLKSGCYFRPSNFNHPEYSYIFKLVKGKAQRVLKVDPCASSENVFKTVDLKTFDEVDILESSLLD